MHRQLGALQPDLKALHLDLNANRRAVALDGSPPTRAETLLTAIGTFRATVRAPVPLPGIAVT